jgi:NNP family nitrate/nitrite transporter-like MFS transporter
MLTPLKNIRVWRFGLYYFLVFGCFVGFSQWLVPYFVSAYYMPLITAGILASCFSFPSGLIRALGGWMSDRCGARKVMYWVLGLSTFICFLLIIPKMDIYSPGQGVMATNSGIVTEVTLKSINVGVKIYPFIERQNSSQISDDKLLVFPAKEVWQEPVVKVGQKVQRKELLAKGITRIHFQANVWIFTFLVFALGIVWGIGKAAVYKHIPDYFPEEVGVVGGMVGVLGGLGGFFCPILFGYLLKGTGLWTSCWMLMFGLSVICLWWMHTVITNMIKRKEPELSKKMDH